jgi:transposase
MAAYRAAETARKSGSSQRSVAMREVVIGAMYVLSTGCQWRNVPKACFGFVKHGE